MTPAKSKAQYRLMRGICSGSIKPRKGLPSKKTACEFIKGQSSKGLPGKARRK